MSHYPVTFHAVLRYLSRIEKVNLAPIAQSVEGDKRASVLAFAACRQLGYKFQELQRTILPEKFVPVLEAVSSIKVDRLVCTIVGGQVVTVLPRHDKANRRRIPSAKELRNTRSKRRRRR